MANEVLHGKVALITGGASGIGREIATQFATAGASVIVTDIDGEGAAAVATGLGAAGTSVASISVDVTKADEIEAAMKFAESEFGRLDIVSCNAGFAGYRAPALEADAEEFDRVFSVNVKGVWQTARSAVPGLRRAGGGAIIIMGSVLGIRTRPGLSAYSASKAAANHLARALALEFAPYNIRVNAIAPSATDTAMLPKFLGRVDPDRAREEFIASIPLGRLGQPEDVARAAVFLASDHARFVTGVVLPVDGGRSI